MPSSALDHSHDNVIDIFTRKPLSELSDNRIIRVAAELDGLEILYSNTENPDKLFSVKLLAWVMHMTTYNGLHLRVRCNQTSKLLSVTQHDIVLP